MLFSSHRKTRLPVAKRFGLIVLTAFATFVAIPRPSVAQSTSADNELPAEVRAIQESLGGPSVNQFPALQASDDGPLQAVTPPTPSSAADESIEALRSAATQLDATANRLERLELYAQADDLRRQAQRLRVDARRLAHPAARANPSRATWIDPTPPGPEPSQSEGIPSTHTTPREQSRRPGPLRRDQPVSPSLDPVPRSDGRGEPLEPQPLLDAPVEPAVPDVEIEG